MSVEQTVRELVVPLVERNNLELYDIELNSGILRVTVDREGGIDVDAIGEISQQISRMLDDQDVIRESKYLLEVSSPGVERRLRLAEHYHAAIGENVRVKLRTAVDGMRRFDGRLVSASETAAEIEVEGDVRSFNYDDIADARTIFDWEAALSASRDNDDEEEQSEPTSNKKASAQ